MSDDEKKTRYIRIVRKLKSANKKISTLKSSLNNLSKSLDVSLNIDDKGYEADAVKEIYDKVDTLQDKNINIINSMVSKINSMD